MHVHVVRSPSVQPGGASWSSLGDEEILLFVAEDGVSEVGARALQRAWATYIDRGQWRYLEHGGEEISATYALGDVGEGVVVRFVESRRGHYDVTLSPKHFCRDTVDGIQRCVNQSVDYGWSYHTVVTVRVRQVF